MPSRDEIVLVTGAPVDPDNWLYRRFTEAEFGPEVTFFAYDEITNLTLAQWDSLKAKRHDDGMRKQLASDCQHAKLDLPREVTNRKARRAAAAQRRHQ